METEPSNHVLRSLRTAIQEAHKLKGSFRKFNENLSQPIDRGKLRRLEAGDDVAFSTQELLSLDEYFRAHGQRSLAVIFGEVNLQQLLAETGDLCFIVGSMPDKSSRRIDMSRWDVRSIREIISQLADVHLYPKVKLEDVIFRGDFAKSEFGGDKPVVPKKEAWYHLLDVEEVNSNILVIGSPRANHCAEMVMARMFEVPPFSDFESDWKLPFWFVWPDAERRQLKSSFIRLPTDIDPELPGMTLHLETSLSATPSRAVAIFANGTIFGSIHVNNKWKDYAIVAVQRRECGQIWACVAGVTAPATLGAARIVPQLTCDLRPTDRGCSEVYWGVVEVDVEDETNTSATPYRADERRAVDQRLLIPLQPWRLQSQPSTT